MYAAATVVGGVQRSEEQVIDVFWLPQPRFIAKIVNLGVITIMLLLPARRVGRYYNHINCGYWIDLLFKQFIV